MSGFNGPQLSKGRGGLGRRVAVDTGIMGLCIGAVAVSGTFVLGTVYKLIQPSDADALGVNAAYDTTNSVKVRYHIDRFFHYNPNGTLYILPVARTVTLAQMCDKANANVKKLVTDETVERKIRVVGVVANTTTPISLTYTTGLDADAIAAIAKAQELVDDLRSQSIYLGGVLIEGRLQSAAAIASLPDMSTKAGENVMMVIGSDGGQSADYADIGAALGMISVRTPGECLGSVDIANKPDASKGTTSYPLTNTANEYFLSAALSNGVKFSALTVAEKAALESKRYVYTGTYEGFSGVFFNDSHTCTELASDYAYLEDNLVWCEAARRVRPALVRFMKSRVAVSAATGKLSATVLAQFESAAQNSCKDLVDNGDLAELPTLILDPEQNFLSTGAIDMTISYVRNGILRVLTGTIGASNPAA